jgi:hypothetical protein
MLVNFYTLNLEQSGVYLPAEVRDAKLIHKFCWSSRTQAENIVTRTAVFVSAVALLDFCHNVSEVNKRHSLVVPLSPFEFETAGSAPPQHTSNVT